MTHLLYFVRWRNKKDHWTFNIFIEKTQQEIYLQHCSRNRCLCITKDRFVICFSYDECFRLLSRNTSTNINFRLFLLSWMECLTYNDIRSLFQATFESPILHTNLSWVPKQKKMTGVIFCVNIGFCWWLCAFVLSLSS